MNNQPQFILYGGQLLNVRDIKRATPTTDVLMTAPGAEPSRPVLKVEFISGGYAFLEGPDISLEGLANTINQL